MTLWVGQRRVSAVPSTPQQAAPEWWARFRLRSLKLRRTQPLCPPYDCCDFRNLRVIDRIFDYSFAFVFEGWFRLQVYKPIFEKITRNEHLKEVFQAESFGFFW